MADRLRDLDVAREKAPNPGWLTAFAGSVKFEAQLLEGHAEEAIGSIVRADRAEADRLIEQVAAMTAAAAMMYAAAEALVRTAGKLAPPSPVKPTALVAQRAAAADDPRGEADR